jgi:hypothetical protein
VAEVRVKTLQNPGQPELHPDLFDRKCAFLGADYIVPVRTHIGEMGEKEVLVLREEAGERFDERSRIVPHTRSILPERARIKRDSHRTLSIRTETAVKRR